MNRKDNKMVTKCSTLSTASETYGFYDDIENTPTSLNNISTMTTTTIHVDEEDAIYGFTSMNLSMFKIVLIILILIYTIF